MANQIFMRVNEVAEELGISIFERTTRRVALTPAGRDFVAYAEQMMVCYEGMHHCRANRPKVFPREILRYKI